MKRTIAEIAKIVNGRVIGNDQLEISGAASFESASYSDITYAMLPKYLKKINQTHACAVIVPKDYSSLATSDKVFITVENPQAAFAKTLQMFYPPKQPIPGIDPSTFIGSGVTIGDHTQIDPFVFIGNQTIIGNGVRIYPHVFIGDQVQIGDNVTIYSNVSILDRCVLGNRIIIHSGTVIGSDGFGFAPEGDIYYKIPHLGIVQIDDDVEIGAGNTIDRGTFGKTWIQKGVKTDNLVHIAHNVVVGENTLLVAQVGIAGSVTIGKHVILAGQAGISGHLEIGDNAIVGPQAGVGRPVPKGEIVSGTPEMPHKTWLKVQGIIPRLPDMKQKLKDLENRIKTLESQMKHSNQAGE